MNATKAINHEDVFEPETGEAGIAAGFWWVDGSALTPIYCAVLLWRTKRGRPQDTAREFSVVLEKFADLIMHGGPDDANRADTEIQLRRCAERYRRRRMNKSGSSNEVALVGNWCDCQHPAHREESKDHPYGQRMDVVKIDGVWLCHPCAVAHRSPKFTESDVWLLRLYADSESCKCKYHGGGLASLADRIESLLPPPISDTGDSK